MSTTTGKILVIAEKPSMGKDIARIIEPNAKAENGYVIGEKYVITWAIGHLVSLCSPKAFCENPWDIIYNFKYTSCAKPLHQQIEKYNLLYAHTFIYMLEKERVALNTLITGNRFLSHENYNAAILELDHHLRSHLEKQNAVKTFPKPKIKKRPKKEIIISQIKLKFLT